MISELLQNPICIGLQNDKKFKVQKLIDFTSLDELNLVEEKKYISSVKDLSLSIKLKIDKILDSYAENIII